MKKILSLVLAAVLVCGTLAACGNDKAATDTTKTDTAATDTATTDTATTDTTTEKPAETEAPAGDTIKVGMVTDVGGVNDKSFNQTSWEGLQRVATDLGIEVNYLESSTDADYQTNIETLIDEEYDLIICVGFMLADATKAAAEANPDQKFAIIDDASCVDLPNVACLMFEQAQASYLVGYAAGMVTESNTIGFVVGMATGPMNEFGYGYLAGAIDANPDIKVLQYNANSFADAALGKTAAIDMVTKGADIIYAAAGGTGAGSIEGCVESDIWAIGVDTDQSDLAPDNMLTSAMKRVDNASYDIAKSVLEGTYTPGLHVYGLEDGGVDIAPTTKNLPEEVLTKIEEVKTSIVEGKVTVPSTKEEFEAAYGDLYELD